MSAIRITSTLDTFVLGGITSSKFFTRITTEKTVAVMKTFYAATIGAGRSGGRNITGRQEDVLVTVSVEEALGDYALASDATDVFSKRNAMVVCSTSRYTSRWIVGSRITNRGVRVGTRIIINADRNNAATLGTVTSSLDAPPGIRETGAVFGRRAVANTSRRI